MTIEEKLEHAKEYGYRIKIVYPSTDHKGRIVDLVRGKEDAIQVIDFDYIGGGSARLSIHDIMEVMPLEKESSFIPKHTPITEQKWYVKERVDGDFEVLCDNADNLELDIPVIIARCLNKEGADRITVLPAAMKELNRILEEKTLVYPGSGGWSYRYINKEDVDRILDVLVKVGDIGPSVERGSL